MRQHEQCLWRRVHRIAASSRQWHLLSFVGDRSRFRLPQRPTKGRAAACLSCLRGHERDLLGLRRTPPTSSAMRGHITFASVEDRRQSCCEKDLPFPSSRCRTHALNLRRISSAARRSTCFDTRNQRFTSRSCISPGRGRAGGRKPHRIFWRIKGWRRSRTSDQASTQHGGLPAGLAGTRREWRTGRLGDAEAAAAARAAEVI